MTTSVPLRKSRDSGLGIRGTGILLLRASRIPFPVSRLSSFFGKILESPSRNPQPERRSSPRPGDSACDDSAPAKPTRTRPPWDRVRQTPSAHARVHDGSGAHGARLNCNIQVASLQPVVAQFPSRLAAEPGFRMRGGIVQMDGPVVCAGYHPSVLYHHSPHRDFPLARAPLRLVQRQAHEVHVIWIVDCRLSIVDWHTPRDFRFSIADWRLRRLDCLSRTDSESTRYYRQSKKGLQFNRQSKIFNRKLVVFFWLAPPAPVV